MSEQSAANSPGTAIIPVGQSGSGRPFLPGQSGNPSGRPKNNKALIKALEEIVNPNELAGRLYALALSMDLGAIKYIYDRIAGMPTQHHELDVNLVREQARLVAEEMGLDPEEVMDEAERTLRTLG